MWRGPLKGANISSKQQTRGITGVQSPRNPCILYLWPLQSQPPLVLCRRLPWLEAPAPTAGQLQARPHSCSRGLETQPSAERSPVRRRDSCKGLWLECRGKPAAVSGQASLCAQLQESKNRRRRRPRRRALRGKVSKPSHRLQQPGRNRKLPPRTQIPPGLNRAFLLQNNWAILSRWKEPLRSPRGVPGWLRGAFSQPMLPGSPQEAAPSPQQKGWPRAGSFPPQKSGGGADPSLSPLKSLYSPPTSTLGPPLLVRSLFSCRGEGCFRRVCHGKGRGAFSPLREGLVLGVSRSRSPEGVESGGDVAFAERSWLCTAVGTLPQTGKF